MVEVVLREGSADAVLALIDRLLAEPDPVAIDFEKVELGPWADIHVHVPMPDVQSAITPPFMEAFLGTYIRM